MRAFDNTPIIVGVGQKTWREPDTNRTPIDAITEVSRLALADPGKDNLAQAIDAIAMVRFIADTDPGMAALFPRNPGKQVAQRLGISGVHYFQGIIGGNTPQYLVNHFARKLAEGAHSAVLISGTQLLATVLQSTPWDCIPQSRLKKAGRLWIVPLYSSGSTTCQLYR